MTTCYFSLFFICLYSKLGHVDPLLKGSYLIQEFKGSLSHELSILFAIERHTLMSTALSCANQCGGDRRCIGLEICKIQEHLYQCRACCGWKKFGKEKANKNLDSCEYFMLVNDDQKGYVNVASKKPTSMSSIYDQTQLSENAVDGVVVCPTSRHYLTHTRREHNPWFKIDLQQMFDIMSVLMYARQDCCEPGRFKNVMVTVSNDDQYHACGFYPGPTYKHDRISVLCESLSRGRFVTLAMDLEPGTTTALHVCEVQVYGKRLSL
ncbi:pentraxin fusion protein-like [Ostrea edulis]|uniref:pentraxin fusion protein-like n=1 Tax=Ostrea edulis TaxID=37623 RepID=UPI0024AECD34|nr:pentraxin fusion protein-like [Ostrea edulis]